MTKVTLKDVTKNYGEYTALRELNLEIESGEVYSLVGPNGSGKTTALKIVAGLLKPDGGDVFFDGEPVTNLPPEKRNVGYVFQDYALFPHTSVFENIAFGVRIRRLGGSEVRKRVLEVKEFVGIEDELLQKYPSQLSGGEQQRVALARALVVGPKVLLLDEPLSALDVLIRERLKDELRRLLKATDTTTLYVTHDPIEALTMADRIGVMRLGELEQTGTPREIFYKPKTEFVAMFVGMENVLKAVVEEENVEDLTLVRTEEGLGFKVLTTHETKKGRSVLVCIKPERIKILTKRLWGKNRKNVFEGIIDDVKETGPSTRVLAKVEGKETLKVSVTEPVEATQVLRPKQHVYLIIDPEDVHTILIES